PGVGAARAPLATPAGGPADRAGWAPAEGLEAFACPRQASPWVGRRACNLVMVLGSSIERLSFERVAQLVEEIDSSIRAVVIEDGAEWEERGPRRPTLVFSLGMLRHSPRVPACVRSGRPLSKSQEYAILEGAGLPVPRWVTLEEGQRPDLSGLGEYVVRKPDHGAKGAHVRLVRRDRVRWKPVVTSAAGPSPRLLVQEFVYT